MNPKRLAIMRDEKEIERRIVEGTIRERYRDLYIGPNNSIMIDDWLE